MHTLQHWEAQRLAWSLEDIIEYERAAPEDAEDEYWSDPFYQECVAIVASFGLTVVNTEDDSDDPDAVQ